MPWSLLSAVWLCSAHGFWLQPKCKRLERSFRSEIFLLLPCGGAGVLHRPLEEPSTLEASTEVLWGPGWPHWYHSESQRGILKALEVPGYGQRLWPGCPYGGKAGGTASSGRSEEHPADISLTSFSLALFTCSCRLSITAFFYKTKSKTINRCC